MNPLRIRSNQDGVGIGMVVKDGNSEYLLHHHLVSSKFVFSKFYKGGGIGSVTETFNGCNENVFDEIFNYNGRWVPYADYLGIRGMSVVDAMNKVIKNSTKNSILPRNKILRISREITTINELIDISKDGTGGHPFTDKRFNVTGFTPNKQSYFSVLERFSSLQADITRIHMSKSNMYGHKKMADRSNRFTGLKNLIIISGSTYPDGLFTPDCICMRSDSISEIGCKRNHRLISWGTGIATDINIKILPQHMFVGAVDYNSGTEFPLLSEANKLGIPPWFLEVFVPHNKALMYSACIHEMHSRTAMPNLTRPI